MRQIHAILFSALVASATFNTAHARDEGSEKLHTGAGSVVLSPVLSLMGAPVAASVAFGSGSTLIIVGAGKLSGEAISFTVENTADGSRYVIQLSGKGAQEVNLSVGSSVKAVAESTGYALIASGKLLAFVPNEIGNSLLSQSKIESK